MRFVLPLSVLFACQASDLGAKPLTSAEVGVDDRVADGPALLEQADLSGDAGSWRFFTVQVPPGSDILGVTTGGGSGDVDLYVQAHTPSHSDFLCRSWNPGTTEVCNLDHPAETLVIGVFGYTAFTGVQLTVRAGKPGDDSTLVINEVLRHDGGYSGEGNDGYFDGNCNGSMGGDEPFIEIVNTHWDPVELNGLTLSVGGQVRHTFTEMPALRPQHTVVVFNGGNALCSMDGAMWDIASTGDLDLWQPRVEAITLAGPDGTMLDQVFVEELEERSWVRSTELDASSPMVPHAIRNGEGASPGYDQDGQPFSDWATSPLELGRDRCEPSYEPNNTLSEPLTLLFPSEHWRLFWLDANDYYSVFVAPGEELDLFVQFLPEDGDIDLELFDDTGGMLMSSTSTEDFEAVTWVNSGTDAAVVTVHVYPFGGDTGECQPYELALSVTAP